MSDEPNHHYIADHKRLWDDVTVQGYALASDQSIVLAETFRPHFHGTYFNEQVLRHDEGDWPVDRQRARDVIRYQWHDDDLSLERHDSITITNRAGIPGKREHARVELLKDDQAVAFIRALLWLVPPDQREPEGTFGVNLFRTFTNVVTRPHHDNERFIIIYVVERIGDGARTHLYHPDQVAADGSVNGPAVLEHQLNPGDFIIFDDKRYKHDASPLISPAGGSAMRDALVCTVDHPGTYLG